MNFPEYFFESPRRQYFSLSKDVISYLLKNCVSPKLFQKLQQTCKYFLTKTKVIVIFAPVLVDNNLLYYYSKNDLKKSELLINKNYRYWFVHQFKAKTKLCETSLFKNIYRCNLSYLNISRQTLTFKEISFFLNGGNIKYLFLRDMNVKYEDGTPVTMDVILQRCPKLTHLHYLNLCETFSTKTFENLKKAKFSSKLEYFYLAITKKEEGKICANAFEEFIKKFCNASTHSWILFKCHFPHFRAFRKLIKQNLGIRWTKFVLRNEQH